MKVLITGGAGYIGTELVKDLSQEEGIEQIIIYDNFSRGNYGLFTRAKMGSGKKITLIDGDILNSHLLRSAVKEVDSVIHLAAKVSTPYATEDPHSYEQVNHWGTAEVVYAVEDSSVRNFIYLSSSSVYGFSNKELDETSKENPTVAYSISKLRGESHVKRLSLKKDRKVTILRSGNVFGYSPSMRFEAVINRLVFDSKYLNKINIHGSGEQKRPFIDVADLVAVVKEILLKEDIKGDILNVFDDNLSINDILVVLKNIFPQVEIQYLNQHVAYGSLLLKQNKIVQEIVRFNRKMITEKIKDLVEHLSF